MIDQKSSAIAPPSTREARGLQLYRDHADEIRFERGVFLVPSLSSETSVYEGRLGTRGASCECRDHGFRHIHCLHIHAATVAKSTTCECAGCSGRFSGHDLVEVDSCSLTFFEGDQLCRPCAIHHGVL